MMTTTTATQSPVVNQAQPGVVEKVIRPSKGWISIDWAELYHSRELFDTLITRDIKIRYKQTVLGVAWAVLQPLAQLLVFVLVFGKNADLKPDGVPYPVFVLSGQVLVTFFTSSISAAGMSLLSQQNLITKIYFPRLYVPVSAIGAFFIDMLIGFVLLGCVMTYYGIGIHAGIVALPLIVLLLFFAAVGFGLILSSITIMFRDLRFVIPFLVQIMLFASPVFYRPDLPSPTIQLLLSLNPLYGIINGFRWSVLGMELMPLSLAISTLSTVSMVVFGLFFFRKSERFFADII